MILCVILILFGVLRKVFKRDCGLSGVSSYLYCLGRMKQSADSDHPVHV